MKSAICKKDGVIVFCATLIGQIFSIFINSEITLIADSIGQLAVAAVTAGEPWTPLISETWYYGWGFNWIFGFLFAMSDNPYVVYMFIMLSFALTNAVGSYFLYRALRLLSEQKTMVMCMFLSIALGVNSGQGYGSTAPNFMIVCVIAYTAVRVCEKVSCRYSIILAIEGVYAISIHQKNVILLAVMVMCILCLGWNEPRVSRKLCVRKVVVPFLTTTVITYAVFSLLKKYIIYNVWSSTGNSMKNASIIRGDMFWFMRDFRRSVVIFLQCFLSNLYTMINNTWGLGGLAIIVFVLVCWNAVKRVVRTREVIDNAKDFIILMFGITTLLIMAGLSFDGARGVCALNYNNYVNWTYHRYYLNYASVGAAFCLIKVWNLTEELRNKIVVASLVLYAGIMIIWEKYQMPLLLSVQEKASRNLKSYLAWFIQTGTWELNIKIAVVIVICILILIRKKKSCCIGLLTLIAVLITKDFTELGLPYCEKCGAIYRLYADVGMEQFPEIIYTESSNRYTLQFMLKSKSVHTGKPPKLCDEAIYYSDVEMTDNEVPKGYIQIQLDENEWILIKGERLSEVVKNGM